MKTLNKTLSLVLVLVMVLGLFGVASAADFKDKAEIENVEAVNTMAALNIINGKNGNVFDPTGTVTRAEMSKMICVALNGGKEPVLGTTANPTYSDIQGHWAAGYIEYCSTLGIVAGMGDGTFAPDATVTGSQAAKMMLVAMNYKADVFGFTGPAWETRVNVEANKAGLYADLGGLNASEGLSRDNAAQLIYNGINAGMMQLSWQQNANGEITQTYSLDTTKTIATEKFGLKTGYGTITNVIYNSVTKKYDHTVVPDGTLPAAAQAPAQFSTEAEYSSLLEMYTKVLYKNNTDGSVTVYGAYPEKSSVILAGVLGQMEKAEWAAGNGSFTLNGTTYRVDTAAVPVVGFNDNTAVLHADFHGYVANGAGEAVIAPFAFKAIDNTGDNRIDVIIAYPYYVEKVTFVNTNAKTATVSATALSNVTSTNLTAQLTAAGVNIDLENDVVYSGIAKDDYVKYTPAKFTISGDNTYEEIKLMEGKVTKTSGIKATVNGIEFVDTGAALAALSVPGAAPFLTLGNTYEDIAQVNTFVFASTQKSDVSSVENYALLIGGGNTTLDGDQAKLLFSDGTIETVGAAANYGASGGSQIGTGANELVTFVKNASTGLYTLTDAGIGAFDYADPGATPTFSDGTLKLGGNAIADDATIFVTVRNAADTADAAYKIYTGAAFKTVAAASIKTVHDVYGNQASTGFKNVKLAHVTVLANVTSGSTAYGYITEMGLVKNADNTTVSEITFWNGTESVTKKAAADYTGTLAKGDIIAYTLSSDDVVTASLVTNLTKAAVTAFDGTNLVLNAATNSTKIEDGKTEVIYIDSANKKGVAGGEIRKADKIGGVLKNNVYFLDGGLNTPFKLVVVDTKNVMADTPNAVAAPTALALAAGGTNGVTPGGSAQLNLLLADATFADTGVAATETIKLTATAAAGTSVALKISGDDYTSGTDYALDAADIAAKSVTVTVTVTEAGKDALVTTYTVLLGN